MPATEANRGRVLAAFAAVYLCWGSTYTAIRVAGEHLPPPVVSATRSILTTVLIVAIALARGKSLRVPRGEGPKLALIGLLFMSGNNMLLTWGETLVPSGFASLIVSTLPIMVALMEWGLPGGEALNKRGWAGTLLGTVGIAVLVWPSLHRANGGVATGPAGSVPLGVVICLLAALCFAVGSVLSRRFHFKADTFVATGWQIGCAGIFNASFALVTGGFHRAVWTKHGMEAILWLSVFGSLVGLVAFTYLLQNVAVTKVATYAFVNPVIAVLLGVLLLGERLGPTELAGMAVIVCSVALVVLSRVGGGGVTEAIGPRDDGGEWECSGVGKLWRSAESRPLPDRRKMALNIQEQFGQIDIYVFDQILRGNIEPGMRVLDAGCGYGRNLVHLLREGCEIFALDADPEGVEHVRKLAALLQPHLPATNFKVGVIERMPFPDDWADVVLCNSVLHFARDEEHFEAMLTELWRVVKPGGMLFCRLGSRIGMDFELIEGHHYRVGDGSAWFLVDEEMLLEYTEALEGVLMDPLKTTVVQDYRCMTTWVMRKRR